LYGDILLTFKVELTKIKSPAVTRGVFRSFSSKELFVVILEN